MKSYLCAAAALAALAIASPALAADTYGNLTYTQATADLSDLSTALGVTLDDAKINQIGARLGAKVTPYFGGELDVQLGLNDDTIHTAPDLKMKISSTASIYAVVFAPVTPKLDLIARAGFGHQVAKVTATGAGSDKANDSAFTYGVGIQYMANAKFGVRGDYTHFAIEDVPDNTWSIGLVRKF